MFYAILGVPSHAPDELVLLNHLTNILINKRVSTNRCRWRDERMADETSSAPFQAANLEIRDSARKPNPFFSVCTTRSSAYSLRWNL